jgi:hypothetical protein
VELSFGWSHLFLPRKTKNRQKIQKKSFFFLQAQKFSKRPAKNVTKLFFLHHLIIKMNKLECLSLKSFLDFTLCPGKIFGALLKFGLSHQYWTNLSKIFPCRNALAYSFWSWERKKKVL